MYQNYKLTYTFQEKDSRDYIYKTTPHPNNKNLEISIVTNPVNNNTVVSKTSFTSPVVYKIPSIGPILDQGSLGSCVANAFAFTINAQTLNHFNISRLYLYSICRTLDFTPLNEDNGTTIRTACNSLQKYGIIPETLSPYIISNFAKFPTLSMFQNAKYFKTFTYSSVTQNLMSLKNCIASNYPIVCGIVVYSSFLTNYAASTGTIIMPNLNTETVLGGHCIVLVGYDETKKLFIFANSWGTGWGNKGFGTIPYDYILSTQLAADFTCANFVY